ACTATRSTTSPCCSTPSASSWCSRAASWQWTGARRRRDDHGAPASLTPVGGGESEVLRAHDRRASRRGGLAETTKAGSQALPRESAFIVAPPGAQGPRDKARTGGASCRDRTEPTEVKLDD